MWFRRRGPRVADELAFHRDRLIEDYLAAGMPRADAERRARLELGDVASIHEAVRDVRGRWWADFFQDLHYAWRTLRRQPGFALAAVLSLGLGIGANAALFTIVNAVMLRALPVPHAGRLVEVSRTTSGGQTGVSSYPLFEHLRARISSLSGLFAVANVSQAVAVDGDEEFVETELVSADHAAVLGLEPLAGRMIGPADVEPGAAPVAVLTAAYWQRRFSGQASVIGRSLAIDDRLFTIVGVAPERYRGVTVGRPRDLILPLLTSRMTPAQHRAPGWVWLHLLGRLDADVPLEHAAAEAEVAFRPFVAVQAEQAAARERAGILAQRLRVMAAPDGINTLGRQLARPLLVVMGLVGLILLLACVNLSGLLLARAAARQREISIRLAIGAGRGRLIRQFLTESLLLALLGGLIGLWMAGWLSTALFGLFVGTEEIALPITRDWRVAGFTLAVSVAACLVAGLAPSLHAVRGHVNPALKEAPARGQLRLGRFLVIAQLAISMVLVMGAGSFITTLVQLYGVDRGFDPAGVLAISVRTAQRYDTARAALVHQALIDRLAAAPDARAASAALILPVTGGLVDRGVRVEGTPSAAGEPVQVGYNVVAPRYFSTIGTPVVAGRELEPRDGAESPRVVVVNESFARRFFGVASPLGRRLTSANVEYEIVGVVRDAKYQSLRDPIVETVYASSLQHPGRQPGAYTYLLRAASGDAAALAPGVDRLVREVDPSLHVRLATPYTTVVNASIATERVMAALGAAFGVLALVVAALGVFGLLAFQVARRTSELGVRLALGATRGSIVGLVLRDVLVMTAIAVAIGVAAARLSTNLARSLLFGVTPADPVVWATAALVLVAAATTAGWLPARRASRIDPLAALRHE